MQTFDPTTNRIPFHLLTPEEQKAIQEWPHGWVCYSIEEWIDVEPKWTFRRDVYRGKPAPIVHHIYINVYKDGLGLGTPFTSLSDAKAHRREGAVKTIHVETVNDKVSVTVLD